MVHKICELYKEVYKISLKIPKRDRFGVFAKIDNIFLETINLTITAALEIKSNKLKILNSIRIKIEVLKRLFRIAHELDIIKNKIYFDIEMKLQEISKMANGWIKYLNN